VTDEDLGLTDLVLVISDVVVGEDGLGAADVVALPDALGGVRALLRDEEIPEEGSTAEREGSADIRTRERERERESKKNVDVPVHELLERRTVGETSTAHFQVVEETQIHDLMHHAVLDEVVRLLVVIGLDATNVVRRRLHQGGDKIVGLALLSVKD
jgi:hypothetical protein